MTTAFARFGMATAQAPFFKNDLEVLNYALTLEHLENMFYKQVNGSGLLQGNAAKYLAFIGKHEQEHVDALTAAISKAGGMPVKARKSYDFAKLGNLSTQKGILTVSEILEDTGVKAYDGAATEIMDKGILGVAGQIVQVEARHVAIIRVLLNPDGNPVPKAFEDMLKPADVLALVGPLLGPEQ